MLSYISPITNYIEEFLDQPNVNYERKHKLIMDLWMHIMDASNFTLYIISFILESSLLFTKHFYIKIFPNWTGYIFNSFIFVWFVVVWW